MLDIIAVTYLKDYTLKVTFENGEKGVIDLSGYAKKGGIFKRFSDKDYFRRVYVNKDIGTICWPGGADIAPETVYKMARKKSSRKQ